MTPEEEKKAQEEAAAQAAAEAAASAQEQPGGEAGSQEHNEGDGGDNGDGGHVTPRDENGAPMGESVPKEVFFERIRTGVPDGKYDEDEQEYYRHALTMLDKAEEGSKKYDTLSEKMLSRFKSNPEEAAAFLDYIDGKPLLAAIREHMGDEALTLKEGDEGWDAYQQASADRTKRAQEQQELIRAQIENANASAAAFEEFVKDENLSEEESKQLAELLLSDSNNITMGKHDKELLKRYLRFLRYDDDIRGSYEQGKADAKNEAIEAEQANMNGSGLPGMSASSVKEKEEDEKGKENQTAEWLKGFRHK